MCFGSFYYEKQGSGLLLGSNKLVGECQLAPALGETKIQRKDCEIHKHNMSNH